MTVIDIRTFFSGYVLSALLCAIVMFSLWWQNRKRSPEIALWLIDYILQFIALLLITFRGLLPDFFTIVVANLFIVGGTVILYIGLGRYVGRESRQLHNYVMLAVFTLACLYLTYVYPDIALRTVNQSFALLYICAQGSWLMLRRDNPGLWLATRATGIVFAALCIVSLLQIVVNLTIPQTHNIFLSGFFGVVAVLMYQMLFIALTFVLFLMVSRRLSTALENELFQRKKAEWAQNERLKELNCLYGISAVIEMPDISLAEIFKKTSYLLPSAWQFPEITEARIELEGKTYQTTGFRETPWMMAQKIIVNGQPVGQVEICYLAERPASDEGPFLIEEHQLIVAVAERLGRVIERNRAEEQIRLNETRLLSLLNIMQHRTRTTQEFLDYALNEVIKLTQSKIGYIYFYHEDRRQFVLNTWSKDVMKECTIANPQTCYELEKTGVWGEAVRQRKPIILNDYPSVHPLKRGYPEGHAPLTKFLTVPVFKDDQIVAVVGVANKASDYDETDVLQLTLFMDAVWKSVDIKMGEEKLRESEESIRAITNFAHDAIIMMDNYGNVSYWNPAAEFILGYTSEEAIGKNLHELIAPKRFLPAHIAAFSEFQQTGRGNAIGKTLELAAQRKDGQEIDVALSLSAVKIKDAWQSIGIVQDISERKRTENYREMRNEILQVFSKPGTLHESIQKIITVLKTRTGFDAVGIRLREGDDFPYFAQRGFSNDFLLTENTLTERGADGGVCRDKDGNINLECTCGLVISGKTDPANPLFTKGGSAWTNDSFPLLDIPSDQEPRLNPRNKCIHQGYASVALVPIRTKDQIVGLMQFNDHRKNCFSPAAIEQFEGIAANIGEALLRKDAEEALRESEERYHFIADHTADHIWTMDLSLRFIYSSPAVVKTLGYTVAELMTQTIDQFFTPEALVMAEKLLVEELEIEKDQNADPNRIRMFQSEHYHKNGTLVWLESSLTFIRDESMKPIGILGVSRDITERKKAEEQIQYLATHDLLTDLPSLRLAKDRLSVALNMARRYKKTAAVMFIDLDGFKSVNDTLGHDAGDYVLKQVAQRLLSCVRETDTVARVGGDEFLIIATEINTPENAAQIADKVIQLVSQPVMIKEQKAVVGASIGIALFPDHGKDMDQLIKQADKAMYSVKNAGKNGFRFANIATK